MARKKNLLQMIEDWLDKDDNTKTRLAKKLGYRSAGVISNWFKRGRVPEYMRGALYEILK